MVDCDDGVAMRGYTLGERGVDESGVAEAWGEEKEGVGNGMGGMGWFA